MSLSMRPRGRSNEYMGEWISGAVARAGAVNRFRCYFANTSFNGSQPTACRTCALSNAATPNV